LTFLTHFYPSVSAHSSSNSKCYLTALWALLVIIDPASHY